MITTCCLLVFQNVHFLFTFNILEYVHNHAEQGN